MKLSHKLKYLSFLLLAFSLNAVAAQPKSGFYITSGLGIAKIASPNTINDVYVDPSKLALDEQTGSRYSLEGNIGVGYQYAINPSNQVGLQLAYTNNFLGAKYTFINEQLIPPSISEGFLTINQSSIDLLGTYQLAFNEKMKNGLALPKVESPA